MAQKTSRNQLFLIVTDWETDLAINTERTNKDVKENDENKLDFIGVLPDEICVKIFSYLDVKSLCRSLQACWKWSGFIEGCTSLWRAQLSIYKSLVPAVPFTKRRNSNGYCKTELQKLYLIDKLMRRWSSGEFSFPKSYDALPGNHIQNLPADVWGTILENELSRKQPIAIRTR